MHLPVTKPEGSASLRWVSFSSSLQTPLAWRTDSPSRALHLYTLHCALHSPYRLLPISSALTHHPTLFTEPTFPHSRILTPRPANPPSADSVHHLHRLIRSRPLHLSSHALYPGTPSHPYPHSTIWS